MKLLINNNSFIIKEINTISIFLKNNIFQNILNFTKISTNMFIYPDTFNKNQYLKFIIRKFLFKSKYDIFKKNKKIKITFIHRDFCHSIYLMLTLMNQFRLLQ